MPGCVEVEVCPCGGPHSWLVPAMLSPPESLLMSCIRRGNFMEAHQVCHSHFTYLLLLLLCPKQILVSFSALLVLHSFIHVT